MKHPLLLVGLAVALGLAAPARGQAQSHPWTGKSVLNDPEWQKRFLGSYGFLSGAEPKVSDQELELLREVIELMKTDTHAAAAMLEQQTSGTQSATLDFVLANLQFQNGDLKSATKYYRSAIDKFPDFRRAHKNLGLLLVQQGDVAKALEHLSKAVELGDRDGRTYGLMGYCYINLEKPLAAEEAYRTAILQQPDVRDWKLGLARSLLALEKYQDAKGLFDELIADRPDDAKLWLLQANAYIGLEQPMAAAVDLEAVRMMGEAQTSSLVLLGDIYMNAGMYELARNAYLEVIHSDEGAARFSTAYRAADLLVRTGADTDAQQILSAIDKRYEGKLSDDDQLKLLTLKAKVARAQGHEKEATKLLESIVDRDGTRGDALLELADHYQKQGDTERALLLVQRAESLKDYEYKALLVHAQVLVSSRDYGKAAEILRRAIEIKREPRVETFLARVEEAVQPESPQ